jgi:geranylgeranyl pyrophosphate synthase
MGFLGAATGQFIDTCPMNQLINKDAYKSYYSSVDKLLDLIYLKTTTFFEIGFLPAYLICIGKEKYTKANEQKMKKMIKYFGLAFQISDDFEDIEQDSQRITNDFNPNLICKYGKTQVHKIYADAIAQFNRLSKELNIEHIIFDELCVFLDNRVNNHES